VALETLAGSDRLRSRRQTLKVLGLGLLGAGAGGLLVQQPWRNYRPSARLSMCVRSQQARV